MPNPFQRLILKNHKKSMNSNSQSKPLLESKTILTSLLIFAIGRFVPDSALAPVLDFLATLQVELGVHPYELLLGAFVVLRVITKNKVDLTKWLDLKKVFDRLSKNRFNLLSLLVFLLSTLVLPVVIIVLLSLSGCQSVAPTLSTGKAPDGDTAGCVRLVGVGPVDLTLCVDKGNPPEAKEGEEDMVPMWFVLEPDDDPTEKQ